MTFIAKKKKLIHICKTDLNSISERKGDKATAKKPRP
jgi:hypothetical protein